MRALLGSILIVEFIFLAFLVFNELVWESYFVALIFITTFAYAVFGYEEGGREVQKMLSSGGQTEVGRDMAETAIGAKHVEVEEGKTLKPKPTETKVPTIKETYERKASKEVRRLEPTELIELRDELEVLEDFFLPKRAKKRR